VVEGVAAPVAAQAVRRRSFEVLFVDEAIVFAERCARGFGRVPRTI
jgi:hypothetical protein